MSQWNKRCMPWWSQLLIGIVMLGIAGSYGLIQMANDIGLQNACVKVAAGLGSAIWIIAGVVFTIYGLSRYKRR